MKQDRASGVQRKGDGVWGSRRFPHAGTVFRIARFSVCNSEENDMLTGGLLWLIGIPIPVILLIWFFFLRGR
ncbi:hypothetical protein AFCDBAGC_0958 [Methylobacterium cerastii]|uniref:Uncharacterized protein n=2 Tax=Methylobacteriaceae TaxID=119045 RepID=A0ABQ4QEG7_9HYPH|nr:hypothetical protein [Methylobacterium sp. WL8]TXN84453.1 hypothetical protein FV234_02695 [Methylobacterium sp. WL8]GJD43114.1 hypothetical protein AFCDBAGC_0958 [Methylobacterium cerastii]